jgi:hypothetical protein
VDRFVLLDSSCWAVSFGAAAQLIVMSLKSLMVQSKLIEGGKT